MNKEDPIPVEPGAVETTANRESRDLEFASRRLSAISIKAQQPKLTRGQFSALAGAVDALGVHIGFEVGEGFNSDENEDWGDALRRMSVKSNFRFRRIKLEKDWWRLEGASLLVWNEKTDTPCAALWLNGKYYIVDGTTGAREPVSRNNGDDISLSAYQLYAGLKGQATFRYLLRFSIRRGSRELRTLVGAAALSMIVGLIVPIATGAMVSTAVPQGRQALLIEYAILVAAGGLGVFALGVTRSLLTVRIETFANMRLQAAIWDRLLRLPAGFFRQFSTGDLVRRVMAIDESRRMLSGPVIGGLLGGVFSVASFVLMLFYDVRLAIFGLFYALFTIAVLSLLVIAQIKYIAAYRDLQGHVTQLTLALIGGLDKLKVAGSEERGFAEWSVPFSNQQRMLWRIGGLRTIQTAFLSVIGSVGIVGMVVVSGYRLDEINLAAFATFNAAFGQFVVAMGSFGLMLGTVASAVPLLQRAAPILTAAPEVAKSAADPGKLSGQFSLTNVSFRYRDDGPPILDQVSFSVAPGEFVALVGASGSGKSTILRLLLGFERPTSGTVFYDDHDIAGLDLRLLRRQIGTVMQSSGVLPGSIYDNIAGARPLGDEVVMEAAKRAAFDKDINSFPMGLDTFISEDAGTLSGGQRQRLMIARALVGEPSIIFLDEATSALDNLTQGIVKESIDQLNVARLVIAHRLSTIQHADRILVLEKGRIVETGSFHSLMMQRGAFYTLAKRQLL